MELAGSGFSGFAQGHAAEGIAGINSKNNQSWHLQSLEIRCPDFPLNRFITSDLLVLDGKGNGSVSKRKAIPRVIRPLQSNSNAIPVSHSL